MNNDLIVVCPHYIGVLKYYDKLYLPLLKENIEIIYLFRIRKNRKLEIIKEMENYCKTNNRKYYIINQEYTWEPLYRYKIKKEIKEFIKKWNPKLILQPDDMHFINDIIVKVARKSKIMTMVLQWATSTPEEYTLKQHKDKELRALRGMTKSEIIRMNIFTKILKIVNYPFYRILGVYTNHKLSFGQGDSDVVGVINIYSKNLFIKQGVNGKKIRVLGLLDYDDALKDKNKPISDLINKYNLRKAEVIIVYFSQPFYKKDFLYFTLEKQLEFLEDLIKFLDKFYTNIGKNYNFFIKLHPIEKLKDYERFMNKKNIIVIEKGDNNELILLSDYCISFMSTVILSIILLQKPILSLNFFDLEDIEIGAKVVGIEKCINSWDEFKLYLKQLENNNYSILNNVNNDMIINDGKCYYRIINLIKKMVNFSKFKTIS
ncbi:MAG: CDP-glycerol glycerophosphotransferase family protein [Promethearchaeota archaeon]